MKTINPDQLARIMPALGGGYVVATTVLNAAMEEFDISTNNRIAYFLAQLAVESRDLSCLEENMNYSSAGLAATWPSRYGLKDASGKFVLGPNQKKLPNQLAMRLARKPEAIANNCYALRGGNGDEASGDGWRFRGAGGMQITFHDGHFACAARFDIPLVDLGAWLRTLAGACRSAAWFWSVASCNTYADRGDFDGVCDRINIGHKTLAVGDSIGYDARSAILGVAQKELA